LLTTVFHLFQKRFNGVTIDRMEFAEML
jgi:hypothetical protein